MKVLFLASGNTKFGISSIIKNQGESLRQLGVEVNYYCLKGKGIKGYLSNVLRLRNYLKQIHYDCIHAHYSLVGIVATLAGAKHLIVSLMGSDIYEFKWLWVCTRVFSKFFWRITIVKSKAMKDYIKLPNAIVLPNGVDFERFRIIPLEEIRNKLNIGTKPIVIFLGNPSKKEKNISLAKKALSKVKGSLYEFMPIHNIDNELVPYYLNAASVLLMTSLWEGSPNVIKEAMACNLPIVTVDVGDVREVIGDTKGCYITTYNSDEIAQKIRMALKFNNHTNGREKIQPLSSENIARRLIELYQSIM